ncbi:MAG TPA: alpha/beta fold hydrolase [Acidimicrobiales bacterium]|nr:alpha/beta fold hydrolase [Acidimicrobiales bacterium]
MMAEGSADLCWDPLEVDSAGTGPDLVVIPGFATEDWTPGLEALTGSYTLHRVHVPGFAGEQPPRGIRSVRDVACLVKAELMSRGLVGAPVLGHSIGGWVAAELASIAHPERLVLVDAMGLRIVGEPRENIFDRPRDAVADLVYNDSSKAPEWSSLGYSGLARFGWSPYLCDPSLPNRLVVLDVPTLVVWGADDRVVPPTHADLFCTLIRGARSEVIAGAGHDPTSEQPGRFAQIVRDFVPSKEASE